MSKRVQMLRHVRDWAPGDIAELGDEEARDMVNTGFGRYAPDEERAVIPDEDVEVRPVKPRMARKTAP